MHPVSFTLATHNDQLLETFKNHVSIESDSYDNSNICSIDLSKAFDKVNHHALFLKLMNRLIPNQLLNLLVSWLSGCYS